MRKSKQQPRAPRAAPSAAELPPTDEDEVRPGTGLCSLWDTKAACGEEPAPAPGPDRVAGRGVANNARRRRLVLGAKLIV
jgi:hypothetical protein